MDQPLVPFSSPLSVIAQYGISPHELALGLLLIAFAFWALFTAVVIYHWLRYSHAAFLSIPSILTHLFVSCVLMLFMFSALAAL